VGVASPNGFPSGGELLPRLSILADKAVSVSMALSKDHSFRALPGTLPCEVRTFLDGSYPSRPFAPFPLFML